VTRRHPQVPFRQLLPWAVEVRIIRDNGMWKTVTSRPEARGVAARGEAGDTGPIAQYFVRRAVEGPPLGP
jgi:hypothetical protein